MLIIGAGGLEEDARQVHRILPVGTFIEREKDDS